MAIGNGQSFAAEEHLSETTILGMIAMGSAVVALLFVGGPMDVERLRSLQHYHRAHA
jgi:hypothetical protein